MNLNVFQERLKSMLGMSDKDVSPEQLLEALEQVVQVNTQALHDADALTKIDARLAALEKSSTEQLTALSSHAEAIKNIAEAFNTLEDSVTEVSGRVDEVAKAKIVKNITVDSHNLLNLNRDKAAEPVKEEQEDNNPIVLDSDLILTAKNTATWLR